MSEAYQAELATKSPPNPTPEEMDLVKEAKRRYRQAQDWEAPARIWFDYDYKFANGDAHNKYQWDQTLVSSREDDDKPCLTINKTAVHNLMVINDAKQNKPGVRIRPTGDKASFDGAQIYQELIYHIEYISNAESVYDSATTFQVEAGIGYWRIVTDYSNNKTFDQEIYIRRIKDPRSVYLDPNINEVDGSDANWAFVFEDKARDMFNEMYPEYASIVGSDVLSNMSENGWLTKDVVRVAEYFKKTREKDKLVTFIDPESGERVTGYYKKEFNEEGKKLANQLKKVKDPSYKERNVLTDNIKWYKIAGDRIIDEGDWAGKYIPIVRLVGTETVIDGILDRKGHTRALINAQQIYNYNTSANVEYGALQTKSPWLAPTEAIEGYEEYWKTANTQNHSYLPYNHMGEDGQAIPAPVRPAAPQPSPAYVGQMQIAQNEMMMATGQYQSQMGENENAKSGIAINARQRQGDKATYHFVDNQAIAIRFTGKIIIDLIPKIYDTKRVMQIMASDDTILNLTIDPDAEQEIQKSKTEGKNYKGQQIIEAVFNPAFGEYDIQSDVGPSFATKRQEAFNALTQIAANNKEFMGIAGDILWEVADFPKAEVLKERYRNFIPPNIRGEGIDKETEEVMANASQMIEGLQGQLAELQQQLKDRTREFDIKDREVGLREKEAAAREPRGDYDSETKRLAALGNAGGPGSPISVEQLQPVLRELLEGMMNNGELSFGNIPEKTVGDIATERRALEPPEPAGEEGSEPPMEGAKQAPDGHWYVPTETGYSRVEPQQ